VEIDLLELLSGQPVLTVFLVVGLGHLLGHLGVGRIRLEPVTGVLLVGILFGRLGLEPSGLSFQIGFILFIYSVGLQAGPSFFSVFRSDGARYLALAGFTALAAVAVAVILSRLLELSAGLTAGVLAGGLTSTPTLAAAQDAVSSGMARLPAGATVDGVVEEIAVGYGITYVIGMVAVMLMVRLIPVLLRIDLPAAAAALAADMRVTETDADEDRLSQLVRKPLVRAYQVARGSELAGPTLRELNLPSRAGCRLHRVKRGGEILHPESETRLEAGDLVSVVAPLEGQLVVSKMLGPGSLDGDLLDVATEFREVVVTKGEVSGRTIGELDVTRRFGCFLVGLSRAQVELPVTGELTVSKGDVLHATGPRESLDALADEMGHVERNFFETDLVPFMFGVAAGLLLGLVSVKLGEVRVGLGMAGGLLVSGVVMGFLHSTNPAFGRAPRAARWILMEFGLLFFMAGIGMDAGPGVVEAVESVGPSVLLAGLVLGVVPLALGFLFGRHVLKMNDALLLGAMTGALTSTAALGIVSRDAKSNLPALGYAGTYPFANILLALAGGILIRI
jgi:putative transport protein